MLAREASKNSQTIEAIAAAVDYPLELDVMSLLTKTPYTLVTRHREAKMELNLEAFFLPASIYNVARCYMNSLGRTFTNSLTQMWTLQATLSTGKAGCAHWKNTWLFWR